MNVNDWCLVTGGAGFIGSHVAEQLLKKGYGVVVLDDLSGGFERNVPAGCKLELGSIMDTNKMEALFIQYSFRYVFHLAAYAAEGLSHFIKRFNYNNNLIGSVNLINAAINHHVRRFIFTSSIAVYGGSQAPVTEETPPEPEDPYGIAKLAVERDLRVSHDMFGLDYVIFRPHNVYGERQNIADRYRNVVGIFMNQLLRGEPMTVFGDGEQMRAFTHVDDVAPIIAEAAESEGARNQVFNVGADVPFTVNKLSEHVAASLGCDPNVKYLPPRNEVKNAFASHEKTEAVFGKRTSIPLEVGLRRMADWVKRHGPMESSVFDAIEVHRNLPPSWAAVSRRMQSKKSHLAESRS
jgi:UDP-glucose 4-epimerase